MTVHSSNTPHLTHSSSHAASSPASLSQSGNKVSPALVLNVLRRWWKIAAPIGLVLAVLAAGAVYLAFEPQYSAESMLQMYRDPRYVVYASRDDSATFINNQLAAIRSRLVLGPVLRQPEIGQLPEIREQDEPLEYLSREVRVGSVGKSEYFEIMFSCPDPRHAAMIANAVTMSYLDFYNSTNSEQLRRKSESLRERRDYYLDRVQKARENVVTLAKIAAEKDASAVVAKPRGEATPRTEARLVLRDRLIDAIVELELLNASMAAVKADQGVHGLGVGELELTTMVDQHPHIAQLRDSLDANRSRLKDVERRAAGGSKSAVYKELEEEIRDQEKELEEARATQREAYRKDYLEGGANSREQYMADLKRQIAQQQIVVSVLEDQLQTEVENTKGLAGDTLQLELARDSLERELDVLRRIESGLNELHTESIAPERVELRGLAEVPTKPEEVLPTKKMGLASMASFVIPFGLAFLWELLVRRVTSRDDIEKLSTLPVISEIPALPYYGRRSSRYYRRTVAPYQESFDSLGAHLLLGRDRRDLSVLAVASAVSGEGKTSVAVQLANSLRRASGKPVLLIDADMRCPQIHRLFDVTCEPGLVEVLRGKCSIEDAIFEEEATGLHVLPAGKLRHDPVQLVSEGQLERLVAELRESYRYIVIDTPPVLLASEALTVHALADGCLVCTMRDVTRAGRLSIACERLRGADAKPIGVVLNGVSSIQYAHRYGGYEYYDRSAGHHADSESIEVEQAVNI